MDLFGVAKKTLGQLAGNPVVAENLPDCNSLSIPLPPDTPLGKTRITACEALALYANPASGIVGVIASSPKGSQFIRDILNQVTTDPRHAQQATRLIVDVMRYDGSQVTPYDVEEMLANNRSIQTPLGGNYSFLRQEIATLKHAAARYGATLGETVERGAHYATDAVTEGAHHASRAISEGFNAIKSTFQSNPNTPPRAVRDFGNK